MDAYNVSVKLMPQNPNDHMFRRGPSPFQKGSSCIQTIDQLLKSQPPRVTYYDNHYPLKSYKINEDERRKLQKSLPKPNINKQILSNKAVSFKSQNHLLSHIEQFMLGSSTNMDQLSDEVSKGVIIRCNCHWRGDPLT
eukprot:403357419